jgi:hypothetical protein
MGGTNKILGTDRMTSKEMSEGIREQVARMLRELGFSPKGRARVYQKPYYEYFDSVSYSGDFRVPDFVKFTRDNVRTTYEHVGQFLAQVSDASVTDIHKVKLFLLSLSDTTFN